MTILVRTRIVYSIDCKSISTIRINNPWMILIRSMLYDLLLTSTLLSFNSTLNVISLTRETGIYNPLCYSNKRILLN